MNEKKTPYEIDVDEQPSIKRVTRFAGLVILIFIGGFLLWAFLAQIDSAIISQGKMTVSGSRRVVQHLDGGVIKKIHVKDGDFVNDRQALVALNDKEPKAVYDIYRQQALELLSLKARLLAERDHQPEIQFAERLTAQQNDPTIASLLDNQRALFAVRQQAFSTELNILKQRISQLREQISGLKAQRIANDRQLHLINSEVKSVKILEAKKLVERTKLLSLQREKARLEGARGDLTAKIAQAAQKIGETELHLTRSTKDRQEKVLSELTKTEQNLKMVLQKELSAKQVFERTAINSPISGYVVGLQVHTVSGVIKPGETLMEIVPDKEPLIIEARIEPNDIDVTHAGLPARIELTAFQSRNLPTLDGEVTYVSADSLLDTNEQPFYLAKVRINPSELKKLSADQKLYPGMQVSVYIKTGTQTPWEYFTAPITKSFGRAFREK